MIVPCIDLLGGKVVQLVQGRDKALEVESLDEMLSRFQAFPQIQAIDLDAAKGTGSNQELIRYIAGKTKARIGGGIRTVAQAVGIAETGAHRLIVGTAAFREGQVDDRFLQRLCNAVGRERIHIALDSRGGHIVIRGWQDAIPLTAEEAIVQLEPYCSGYLCTYVDREGLMQGTNLDWFRGLRVRTGHELTAAGGITTAEEIKTLTELGIDCAIGMAIYTGRLDLQQLLALDRA